MAVNNRTQIQNALTAMTSTNHTFAMSASDELTEAPTTGPAVQHSGVHAAQGDAAKAQAVMHVANDITKRQHLK